MRKKNILTRIIITALLSVVFTTVIRVISPVIESQILLTIMLLTAFVLMFMPLFKPIMYLFSSESCKVGWWRFLKGFVIFYFLLCPTLLIILNNFSEI